uniref:Uncharacterized protein n=1 Tax=Nothobranchius pienaari TaxID=704102 RepID=A0A1A8QID1_9TELE
MCQSRPPLLLLPSIHTNTQLWQRSVSPWQPIPRTESSAGPFRLKGFGCEAESLYNGTRADAEQHRGALVERNPWKERSELSWRAIPQRSSSAWMWDTFILELLQRD